MNPEAEKPQTPMPFELHHNVWSAIVDRMTSHAFVP